jgi:hypothetical protein
MTTAGAESWIAVQRMMEFLKGEDEKVVAH